MSKPVSYGKHVVQQPLHEDDLAEFLLATAPDGQPVVIRQLTRRLRLNLAKRQTFIRGLQIQAKMKHPNIIRVHEFKRWHWTPYAVLEYVEGINLRQALSQKDPLLANDSTSQILHFFEKMVEALQHVHEQKFMHLDFNPENVLINQAGELKLFDFRRARPIPKTPKPCPGVHGTPHYLAPKQILGHPVDERADIFALGITAYEMFVGRKPVTAEAPAEIFDHYKRLDARFPPPAKVNASIPAPLSKIIESCTEKRVERRYPSLLMIKKELHKLKNTAA